MGSVAKPTGLASGDLAVPWVPYVELAKVARSPVLVLIFMNAWLQPKPLENLISSFPKPQFPTDKLG